MTDHALDLQAIHNLLARYVIAVDTRRPDLLDEVFLPDSVVELAGMGVMTPAQYRDICATVLPTLDATLHHLSMPAIVIDGDTAQSRCYFLAQHVKNTLAPRPFLMIGGWYDDVLVRTPEGWRIRHRRGTALWSDGNPAVVGAQYLIGAAPRDEGHEAPAWLPQRPLSKP